MYVEIKFESFEALIYIDQEPKIKPGHSPLSLSFNIEEISIIS
jgi:hypothetical protein